MKNRIKSYLAFNGIVLPNQSECSHWSGAFLEWLNSLEFSSQEGKMYLQICLEELQQTRQQIVSISRHLRDYIKEHSQLKELFRDLRSIPGIGFITALFLYTELIDIKHFPGLDHLAAFVGLVPSTKSSGERERNCGVSIRQNRYLRYLLVEASWVAVRKDPALTLCFNGFIQRMPKQRAIIRIARKLLNRIRHVWIHQCEYSYSVVE